MKPLFFHRQSGISLIESLVALLVLALGILGLAGLQTRTLVESRTTNARAVAIDMVDDLSERIQFNIDTTLGPGPNPYIVNFGALPAPNPQNCVAAPCTPQQLAQVDLFQWKTNLAALLPAGDAQVFAVPPVGNNDPAQIGVLIGWDENVSAQDDDANYRAVLNVNTGVPGVVCPNGLTCHLVFIRP